MNDAKNFSQALAEVMQARGWSTRVAAAELDIARSTLVHLLDGSRELTPTWAGRILARLAARDDVSTAELNSLLLGYVAEAKIVAHAEASRSVKVKLDRALDTIDLRPTRFRSRHN